MNANDAAAAEWREKARGWLRHEEIVDRSYSAITDALWEAAGVCAGDAVLDVGCGGGTLLELAAGAGAGAVYGVDISQPMVAAARSRAPSAVVARADAQTEDLSAALGAPPLARLISRFGVMFFDAPTAAFANLRAAAAPGARLAFASWHHSETSIFRHGLRAAGARVAELAGRDPFAALPGIDEPGPLGLATEDRIRSVLTASGWSRVEATALRLPVVYGAPGTDGVAERMAVALGGSSARRLREAAESAGGEGAWVEALEMIRREVAADADPAGSGVVRLDVAVWIVSALNPAVSPNRR